MIDMICPECGDECEIDETELSGAESIECEDCGAEFAYTMKDGALVLGEVLKEGEDFEDDGEVEGFDEEEEDDDTVIEVEEEEDNT